MYFFNIHCKSQPIYIMLVRFMIRLSFKYLSTCVFKYIKYVQLDMYLPFLYFLQVFFVFVAYVALSKLSKKSTVKIAVSIL